jgi:ABC-type lipoprotein export system ATPase subunit
VTHIDGSREVEGRPLIELEGISVAYGSRVIVADVSLTLRAGEEIAITGRSGSGKTSLLLVAAGLLAPAAGAVRWPGLDADLGARRAEIAMIFQAPSLIPELSAFENVCLPLRLAGIARDEARQRAEDSLAAFDFSEGAHVLPAELSGGQQQRVAAARAIAGRPRVIMADEPTGTLNRALAQRMIDELRGAVQELGTCLVIATHDESIARQFDARFDISDGSIRKMGPR